MDVLQFSGPSPSSPQSSEGPVARPSSPLGTRPDGDQADARRELVSSRSPPIFTQLNKTIRSFPVKGLIIKTQESGWPFCGPACLLPSRQAQGTHPHTRGVRAKRLLHLGLACRFFLPLRSFFIFRSSFQSIAGSLSHFPITSL